MTRASSWLAALLAALAVLSGCSTRFADVIVLGNAAGAGAGGGDAGGDVCQTHTAAECVSDTAHGCSFQPNPTGCFSTDPSCGSGQCRAGNPFVSRNGESLFLHDEAFHFTGTVSWWLSWQDGGCQSGVYSSQQAALTPTFDELATMRLSGLRFWAYQSYAGASGTDYSHFDRVVARARAAGVRLMPVLESMYADCSASPGRDDAWFASGYKSPYGNYALSFRNYVAGLVTHFRDEPTIFAWELMHEAGSSDFGALDAFTDDMSSLIRGIDHNHLIALGVNNGSTSATNTDGDNSNYFKLHAHDGIDLLDVHDFGNPDDAEPSQVARCRAIAHELHKPIFVGAGAVELGDTTASAYTQRADRLSRKIEAAQSDAFAGYLVYDYVPGWTDLRFDFDARAEEPLAGANGVLAQHATKF
jgi:mannan endo-1,4-beta-mannosidase